MVLVDDRHLEVVASCQPVTVLWSDSITSSSANIVWTGTDAAYSIKVSTTSINPETTQGDVFDGVVTTTQLRLNNLVQHKNYYYYVNNNCDVNGQWSVENLFKTDCASLITTLPFEENFDDYGTKTIGEDSSFPTCWIRHQTAVIGDKNPYITAGGMKYGVGALQFYTQPNNYAVAVMPEVDVDNIQEVCLRMDGGTPSVSNFLSVGVMTDPNDLSTFV